ncbi:MAG: hypothetical protein AAF600_00355 [Bacteroidota bacterium]
MRNTLYSFILVALVACSSSLSQEKKKAPDFNGYWYAGEAEISSYELQQVRYGEIHQGTSVLVFVTEPFSKNKQVKLDDWRNKSEDNVSVLKLNMTKKFLTGIYPYSMMMSTFVPVSYDQHPNIFKITTSSQEWCGHTWMQLNFQDEAYRLKGLSYFESEGDVDVSIPEVVLEDELWTRIRLNPSSLPLGEVRLLPSTFYLRLKHQDTAPKNAKISLTQMDKSEFGQSLHAKYSIIYDDRSLHIYFQSDFPYTILGWEESYSHRFGDTEKLTTKAKKINTIKSAYWKENSNSSRVIRKELGLEVD